MYVFRVFLMPEHANAAAWSRDISLSSVGPWKDIGIRSSFFSSFFFLLHTLSVNPTRNLGQILTLLLLLLLHSLHFLHSLHSIHSHENEGGKQTSRPHMAAVWLLCL